jgi:hypothetical protein
MLSLLMQYLPYLIIFSDPTKFTKQQRKSLSVNIFNLKIDRGPLALIRILRNQLSGLKLRVAMNLQREAFRMLPWR